MSNLFSSYDGFKQKMKDIFLILLVVLIAVIGWYYLQDNPILEDSLGTIDPTAEVIGEKDDIDVEVVGGGDSQTPPSNTTKETDNRANLPSVQDGSYLIYYFSDGFYPNVLQIRQGNSVRYINKSEGAMRIFAIDDSEFMFRELNQPKTVGGGGTYDFTFTKKGVWLYSNYNNKIHQASVLVY